MSVLVWKHGTSLADARQRILLRLRESGYENKVTWKGYDFFSSIGWGTVLDVAGRIDDAAVIIDKSGGLMGDLVLKKSEATLKDIFPMGQLASCDATQDSAASDGQLASDQADEDSFPASDPPSMSPISHVGGPVQ